MIPWCGGRWVGDESKGDEGRPVVGTRQRQSGREEGRESKVGAAHSTSEHRERYEIKLRTHFIQSNIIAK
jgi:hypothetical protein